MDPNDPRIKRGMDILTQMFDLPKVEENEPVDVTEPILMVCRPINLGGASEVEGATCDETCDVCGVNIWMAPDSFEVFKHHKSITKVCLGCGLDLQKAAGTKLEGKADSVPNYLQRYSRQIESN